MKNQLLSFKSSCLMFCLICFLFVGLKHSIAQGGIYLNTPEATPSYTLIESIELSNPVPSAFKTYLIDNCGEVVHQWNHQVTAWFHRKLLPSGNLMYMASNLIFEENWEGDIVVELAVSDSSLILDYELIKLENGNYLSIGRRPLPSIDFVNLGFELENFYPEVVDVIVEIEAITGNIVWEWNIVDHIIQERDQNVGNYGIVADHPELLNVDAISDFDWQFYESFMINGFDYNPSLDQIVLSIRKLSEIIIIDHSTTTLEAAGHTGGNSGRGGDILYRWGNPQNYDQGTGADRFLYFQHNPNWIEEGPHADKIICYNNGLGRPNVDFEDQYSDVPIISPPVDAAGNYSLESGEAYLPEAPDVTYSGDNPDNEFYSGYYCGAANLPNGNTFITIGQEGRLIELNTGGELVWDYTLPNELQVYRVEKYPLNYAAFEDIDLIPDGPAPETNSNYDCEITIVGTDDIKLNNTLFEIRYVENRNLEVINENENGFYYQVFDVQGKNILKGISPSSKQLISFLTFSPGFYVLSVYDSKNNIRGTYKIVL